MLFCSICQVAFLSKCFLKQESEYKGKLHSQIGPKQTRKGLSSRPPLSTATYSFRCNKLPRAASTSSPRLLHSLPFFTPMTLDSNPIQVSRMNCSEDHDGCGNGQCEEGIHGADCWQHLYQIIEYLTLAYF